MSQVEETRRGGRNGERGAVYIELMIAFMPVFTFFLSLLQLAFLYTDQLFVEHTATVSARVAALALGERLPRDLPNAQSTMLGPQRIETVRNAAVLTMAPLILDGSLVTMTVEYPRGTGIGLSDPVQQYAVMTDTTAPFIQVRIRANMACKIAIANRLLCGVSVGGLLGHPTKMIMAESTFPIERTHYVPSAACAVDPNGGGGGGGAGAPPKPKPKP
jgi:hypothetical protein